MTSLDALRDRVSKLRALPPAENREALRKAAGLTLAEVAEACDVSRECVRLWELGLREPNRQNLDAYLSALDVMRGHA